MRERIMQGWPFTAEERADILTYCASDVDAMVRLLPKLLPHIDMPIALYRGAFVAVSAQMEHVGVPIDMEIFPQLADKQAWRFVRDAMVPEIDAQYGVYVRGRDGEWHFNMELFAAYTAAQRHRVAASPSAAHFRIKRKTFDDMAKGHPQLENLRQLRHAREQDAQGQAGGRRRRPQSHRAVAVPVEDLAHAAEGVAVDILARRLAALSDQARTRAGGRLCRLEFDGVHDRGQPVATIR